MIINNSDREVDRDQTPVVDYAVSAASSLSSAVSVNSIASRGKRGGKGSSLNRHSQESDDYESGSGNPAREPLLADSLRMTQTSSANHLISGDYGDVESLDTASSGSQQASTAGSNAGKFGSDFYSSREYTVNPSLGGIQFHLDPDSTTVSGEYVNIMDDDGKGPASPTTVALQKCKQTVVKPYLTLLSLLGWFPIIPDNVSRRPVARFFNVLYPVLAVCLILFAYVVQFAACFRRDGITFRNQTIACYSNAISIYLIPDLLHSAAYIYAFYLFRYQQNENLVTLMERVFLQSSLSQTGYLSQDRLISRLKWLLRVNILWVGLSLVAQIVHVVGIAVLKHENDPNIISFTWMNVRGQAGQIFLVIMMLIGFIALDIVYAAIVINYATHCELLILMLRGMSARVLQKTDTLQDVMKEIMVIQKYLKYTNESVATAVSLLMFNFGTAIVIGIQSASLQGKIDNEETNGILLAGTVISLLLWIAMFLIPLIQAARLSTTCWSLGKIGLEVAARPFGFQTLPQDEINAFLTFTTSLQLRAKLFRIPVRSAHMLFILVAGAFAIMVLLTVKPEYFNATIN